MIDPNYIIALISFYLVMYITPGPNNAMILASGIKFGFKRTIPVILGITVGHNFQLLLVCSGFGKVFKIWWFSAAKMDWAECHKGRVPLDVTEWTKIPIHYTALVQNFCGPRILYLKRAE